MEISSRTQILVDKDLSDIYFTDYKPCNFYPQRHSTE